MNVFLKFTPLFFAFQLAACSEADTTSVRTDVTIYLSGELLKKGGAIMVYPLPISEQRWQEISSQQKNEIAPPTDLTPIAKDGVRFTASLSQPFYQFQFYYPEGNGHYVFRFRPAPDSEKSADQITTRAISIGGIDSATGYGEKMDVGFVGQATSGSQLIHINTEALGEPSARVLAGLTEDLNKLPLSCDTQVMTSVCTYTESQWPTIRQNWQVGLADLDKEYRRMDTLNKCYRKAESEGKGEGSCQLISEESAEAVYEFRENNPRP